MKILTLVWSIGIGGTERGAVNYAIGYKLFGNDSKVLVIGDGHERYGDLQGAGVETTLLTKSAKPIRDIYEEYHTWSPDIVHIHNYNDAILTYFNIIKGPQTKLVETNVFSRPNYSLGYRKVNLSMQLSGWGYWRYDRRMKGSSYRPETAIVPYIVDGSKFGTPGKLEIRSFLYSYNIPSNAYVIGRLGQEFPAKWDIRLLEVIKQTILPDNNIYYLLVGVPSNLANLFNEQADFFKSRVVCIKKIEGDKNLTLYYHSLNCFAHISKIGESFGYVLAEAMVCKIPVITMLTPLKDNAQFEVVGHEHGGICVSNTKEFITAVFRLHNDKKVALSIKTNLPDWIVRRFSYSSIIPRQIQLYNSLLQGKKIPHYDMNSLIEANLKYYKDKTWIIYLLIKFINTKLVYNLIDGIKRRKKF